MPTYIYETIPSNPEEAPVQFEVRQSMNDAPLKVHPETGQPVRRIITGGFGIMKSGSSPESAPSGSSCCGGGCACHN